MRAAVRRDGVVSRRDDPALATSIDALVRKGELRIVLPGVFTSSATSDGVDLRVLALARWAPEAVLLRDAAARLTFWPTRTADVVEAALRARGTYPGYRFTRRQLPPEVVVRRRGIAMTTPAMTALDLADGETEAIDLALRTRSATLDQMREALRLTPGRRGNRQRLVHLLDSRDEPWSAAERLTHRLLREAGIRGWRSNHPVVVDGRLFFVDVAFVGARVAVEVDGRLHELDIGVFENDRWRQNALVLGGWTVLRFTWAMLTRHPEVVLSTIEAALADRAAEKGSLDRL
ncbi:Very-short-patch-repair endonuclease [Microlunatus flavus]|uniref:Very-short-patch-repair endonuclease n=1 Tax=Microlunatus flavus TaxID=1036181 RepID=A0A1H9NF89_9ACTN|nr:Very-short-patch-repair endonuclease [Microlunatus flavus]